MVENGLALPAKPGGLSQRFYRGKKGQAANLPEFGVRKPRRKPRHCVRLSEKVRMS